MKTKSLGKQIFFIFHCMMFLLTGFSSSSLARPIIQRVDPPFWFQHMKSDTLQLLFYGDGIHYAEVKVLNNKAKLISVQRQLSVNYLIAYFEVNQQIDALLQIEISLGKQKQKLNYEFRKLVRNPLKIDASDVMYLLMPDRFANAIVANDQLVGMHDPLDRDKPKGRHGGDLKGIENHLDYITELGMTSLWINPLIENNQKVESYHGYAATDFYRIDARFGNNVDYLNLSNQCQAKGIKLVMDVVYNHIGIDHPFYQHMISKEWFHLFDTFTRSNYRGAVMVDPYASEQDKRLMCNGWFDKHMPDLDQSNPDLSAYLIQNTLWWVAYAKLAGVRIDTYPYPDLDFMINIVEAIKLNFPNVFVFGETWEHGEPLQAYFAKNEVKSTHQSALDGVTDFQLYFAINKAFTEPFGWTEGLSRLYYVFAKDYLYTYPNTHVIFADNHDLDRIFGVLNNDINKMKMAMGFLLTSRGIPCIYYGTELLMNEKGDHGLLRKDMPGGWPGDTINVFEKAGRSNDQNEMFTFISTLSRFRKTHAALFNTGKRIQFIPEKGVYAYFIQSDSEKLGVFINQNSTDVSIELGRFAEIIGNANQGLSVIDGKQIQWNNSMALAPESIAIISFK